MDAHTLANYTRLVRLDLLLNGMISKYPFRINERAKYTQHELQIYQRNYCSDDKRGGAPIDVAIVDV